MKEEGYSVSKSDVHMLIILLKLHSGKIDANSNIASRINLFKSLKMS
jgi:hypothetical protein